MRRLEIVTGVEVTKAANTIWKLAQSFHQFVFCNETLTWQNRGKKKSLFPD